MVPDKAAGELPAVGGVLRGTFRRGRSGRGGQSRLRAAAEWRDYVAKEERALRNEVSLGGCFGEGRVLYLVEASGGVFGCARERRQYVDSRSYANLVLYSTLTRGFSAESWLGWRVIQYMETCNGSYSIGLGALLWQIYEILTWLAISCVCRQT